MGKQAFNRIDTGFLEALKGITGAEYVNTGDEMEAWTHDYTENLRYSPEVVVKPANTAEISLIMKLCSKAFVPITPSGGRTGLSGGMLPIHGGVILATDRLNQILEIDTENLQVRTQPGVVTEALMQAVEAYGLAYPVDPASKGSCFIGGNIAECSGGLRAVKYGITREYVLGLEVVLPNGEIIHTGAKTLKNSTGYNLTQLIIGSEGTLGIVTEATLKLVPKASHRKLMLIPFFSAQRACEAVSAVFKAGILPSAMEFIEKEAIDFAQDFLAEYPFDTNEIEAQLMVEVDGNDPDLLLRDCETIFSVMESFEPGEILFADSPEEQNRLWKVRRAIGEATRAQFRIKEEDTCVPRARLADLWCRIKAISKKQGFKTICFGHAGDGNLHVHILMPPENHPEFTELEARVKDGIREIFAYTVSLGGTLSGEHGIGLVQKEFMDLAFSNVQLDLMRGIKRIFDPLGILNPGKIFPDS